MIASSIYDLKRTSYITFTNNERNRIVTLRHLSYNMCLIISDSILHKYSKKYQTLRIWDFNILKI